MSKARTNAIKIQNNFPEKIKIVQTKSEPDSTIKKSLKRKKGPLNQKSFWDFTAVIDRDYLCFQAEDKGRWGREVTEAMWTRMVYHNWDL